MLDPAAPAPGPILIRHPVPPELAGLVAGIVGFAQHSAHPVARRQPAGSLIPLILSFGPTLDVVSLSNGVGVGRHRSFIAGFMPGYASTRFEAEQHCLQIYLTPLGVTRLLGVPGRELAGRVLDADAVAPWLGAGFRDQLRGAGTWADRFALVDRALRHRLTTASLRPEPFVAWMWEQIRRTSGRARIGELIAQTGWSQRHAIARFTEQIGVSPKTAARVVRFEHALTALPDRPAAEVAARLGFADQSHLIREVRRFSGWTPSELTPERTPTARAAIGGAPELLPPGRR
ncbi:helix-turn-helix domain-containing protein [Granulicoccus phenolivorans]|uniref:helix-turn-helix domain-containing protein n=1 Tax=Granulicoccus phenolivorans TaxID=266854 RepID=UPI00040167E0|nr:helix-turn-helix domain-containing protein [Granulicoccus phenolivorans]